MSNYVQMLPIADAVSAVLGEGWSAEAGTWNGGCDAYVRHSDGRGVYLLVRDLIDSGKPLRIEISADKGDLFKHWPKNPGKGWESLRHEITVSVSKSPESIARDIERRLLPGYQTARVEALARKADHDAYRGRQASVKACILANLPGSYGTEHDDRRVYLGSNLHGRATVSADHATFDVQVPTEYVAEFSAFLARMARGE